MTTAEATKLRQEARSLGRANRRLREAIQYTAIPTLLVFAEHNDGVRDAVRELRHVVADSVRQEGAGR
jgi:hypothetical protein